MTDRETLELRDRFAMAALTGLLARPGVSAVDTYARAAYRFADAMLAERARQPDEAPR